MISGTFDRILNSSKKHFPKIATTSPSHCYNYKFITHFSKSWLPTHNWQKVWSIFVSIIRRRDSESKEEKDRRRRRWELIIIRYWVLIGMLKMMTWRRLIGSWPWSGILIRTPITRKMPKLSSSKSLKPMRYLPYAPFICFISSITFFFSFFFSVSLCGCYCYVIVASLVQSSIFVNVSPQKNNNHNN